MFRSSRFAQLERTYQCKTNAISLSSSLQCCNYRMTYLKAPLGAVLRNDADVWWIHACADEWIQIVMPQVAHLKETRPDEFTVRKQVITLYLEVFGPQQIGLVIFPSLLDAVKQVRFHLSTRSLDFFRKFVVSLIAIVGKFFDLPLPASYTCTLVQKMWIWISLSLRG